MSHILGFLTCLRNRDFDGLGDWLHTLLELTKDEATLAKTGKMLYDGVLLVPLLQSGDHEMSRALLANPNVRSAMQSKDIEHDSWILDIAQNDTFAWLWALEQGWGELVEPRPSVLKTSTILNTRGFIDSYFADQEKTKMDKVDIQKGKDTWDSWLRLANKRNPWLIGHIYSPKKDELEQLARCNQKMALPLYFWQNIEALYPGAKAMKTISESMYSNLGLFHGAVEDKMLLEKLLNLIPQVPESMSMEFESGL